MKLTLTGDTPSKKNSRAFFIRNGRPFFVAGKKYQQWHRIQEKALQGIAMVKDIESVEVVLYPATRRASDLTNKAESVFDTLVDCGILEDDNWFVIPHIVLRFGDIDRLSPRAEVTITTQHT